MIIEPAPITMDAITVDPQLSGSRTEIIARAYNDLRMRVVVVDKKKYCIQVA